MALDPLALLRNSVMNKTKVECVNGNLYFGNTKVSLNHPTAWQPNTSGRQYDIGSLWFFLQNSENSTVGDYVRRCSQLGVQMVSHPDRSQIISYFTGEIDNSDAIKEELRLQTMIERAQEKRTEERKTTREVLERPLRTKESILQSPTFSFKYLQGVCQELMQRKRHKRKDSQQQIPLIQEILQKTPKGGPSRPIIIVPNSEVAGNLTLKNSESFLINAEYVDPFQVRHEMVHEPLIITHRIKGRPVEFEIWDSVFAFKKEHWRNVVAVFVQGPQYQFKDWPHKDMVSLFRQIRGFMLKYQGVPLDMNVKNWNVKVLEVNRHQRHLDKTVVNEFWSELERTLLANRPKSQNVKSSKEEFVVKQIC